MPTASLMSLIFSCAQPASCDPATECCCEFNPVAGNTGVFNFDIDLPSTTRVELFQIAGANARAVYTVSPSEIRSVEFVIDELCDSSKPTSTWAVNGASVNPSFSEPTHLLPDLLSLDYSGISPGFTVASTNNQLTISSGSDIRSEVLPNNLHFIGSRANKETNWCEPGSNCHSSALNLYHFLADGDSLFWFENNDPDWSATMAVAAGSGTFTVLQEFSNGSVDAVTYGHGANPVPPELEDFFNSLIEGGRREFVVGSDSEIEAYIMANSLSSAGVFPRLDAEFFYLMVTEPMNVRVAIFYRDSSGSLMYGETLSWPVDVPGSTLVTEELALPVQTTLLNCSPSTYATKSVPPVHMEITTIGELGYSAHVGMMPVFTHMNGDLVEIELSFDPGWITIREDDSMTSIAQQGQWLPSEKVTIQTSLDRYGTTNAWQEHRDASAQLMLDVWPIDSKIDLAGREILAGALYPFGFGATHPVRTSAAHVGLVCLLPSP
ncbi:MAG: hypothetical protein AAGJ19_05585 [Myxococcota bacterium]